MIIIRMYGTRRGERIKFEDKMAATARCTKVYLTNEKTFLSRPFFPPFFEVASRPASNEPNEFAKFRYENVLDSRRSFFLRV